MPTGPLDDFEDIAHWTAVSSGQAELRLSQDRGPSGKTVRLDFDFKAGKGFVVASRAIALTLPEAYAFIFSLCGCAPPNTFEFKLIDPSSHNVWWYRQEALAVTPEWRSLEITSRQIQFAWGPAGGGTARNVGAVEFVIAAGSGGSGTVWIGDVRLEDRSYRETPVVTASSAAGGHRPAHALDGRADTGWRGAWAGEREWLSIDFGARRDYGGLVIEWDAAVEKDFEVEVSDDGDQWTTVYAAEGVPSTRSYLYLPNGASRQVRLSLTRRRGGQGFGIVDIGFEPLEFSRTVESFFHAVARREPCGFYPKYLWGEQTYWSPVGAPEGGVRGLLNEEGMLEVGRGAFSIEPFLFVDGRLITWADAAITHDLEQGYLPIPSSHWHAAGIALTVTAFACGPAPGQGLAVRYRLRAAGEVPRRVRLFAALRPFQVTPPWQAYDGFGGIGRVAEIACDGARIVVDGRISVLPLTPPDRFGAAAFAVGGIAGALETGDVPAHSRIEDSSGWASGALAFDVLLEPGATAERVLLISPGPAEGARADALFESALRDWVTTLGGARIRAPGAQGAVDTFKTAAAHILINRDGAALQPGPRRYTRSWIRDGALMAAALLRVGRSGEVRDFIRWYGGHQADDGRVPCCVDRRGPDWLPEHDSEGEFIYAVAEYARFTGDLALAAELWPRVKKAVDRIEALRGQRLTPEFDTPQRRIVRGLLPESVSHEGYLAHPVHAFWDDFWALRGLKDAAYLAAALGHPDQARRATALADALRASVTASIQATMATRHIDFVPGSVELADCDPASTAILFTRIEESLDLPREAVSRTFDQFLARFHARLGGGVDWINYSPYEIRIIGAFVRLGDRARSHELMGFFLGDRRPRGWNQWSEIAWRDPKSPGHIGDMPHTWVSAEYMLAFRDMLVYECERRDALVVGAGIPMEWIEAGGIEVDDLPTAYGPLSFKMASGEGGSLQVSLSGDLCMPPGRIVLLPPVPKPLREVFVNGEPTAHFTATEVTVESLPCVIVLHS